MNKQTNAVKLGGGYEPNTIKEKINRRYRLRFPFIVEFVTAPTPSRCNYRRGISFSHVPSASKTHVLSFFDRQEGSL